MDSVVVNFEEEKLRLQAAPESLSKWRSRLGGIDTTAAHVQTVPGAPSIYFSSSLSFFISSPAKLSHVITGEHLLRSPRMIQPERLFSWFIILARWIGEYIVGYIFLGTEGFHFVEDKSHYN